MRIWFIYLNIKLFQTIMRKILTILKCCTFARNEETSKRNVNYVTTVLLIEPKFGVWHVGPIPNNIASSVKLCAKNEKKYVNFWRHFGVLILTLRQIWEHLPERPWVDEQNGAGLMSLSSIEQKLQPKMCFQRFGWPWPWPLNFWDKNYLFHRQFGCQNDILIWSCFKQ